MGELPDAAQFGDTGSNTLAHTAEAKSKKGEALKIPNLVSLGAANLTPLPGVKPLAKGEGHGAFGKCEEKSRGKDTTSGHWEIAGLVTDIPFKTFPQGFPQEAVDRWVKENSLPGILGNTTASGTEIIKDLGDEHLKTGKPILYTSADSVWQVAAHEESFGLKKLYEVCESARKICDEMGIARVIARPFIGNPAQGKPYDRTYNRKDYSFDPPGETCLEYLQKQGFETLGIGKISNIYAGRGVTKNIDTKGNTDGIKVLMEQIDKAPSGTFVFCNLIDFDMLYGHRRDALGMAKALEEFDVALGTIFQKLKPGDLLLISADHGNDPTFKGTDHTREYIPILAYSPSQKIKGAVDVGIRSTFSDIGRTLCEFLGAKNWPVQFAGKSFLPSLGLE